MEKEKVKSLYKKIITTLNKYNEAYYDKDNPIVSYKKYDDLKGEILKLER